jgi:hypothetical protein
MRGRGVSVSGKSGVERHFRASGVAIERTSLAGEIPTFRSGHAVAPFGMRLREALARRLKRRRDLHRKARNRPGQLLPRPGADTSRPCDQCGHRPRGLLRRGNGGARLLARERECPSRRERHGRGRAAQARAGGTERRRRRRDRAHSRSTRSGIRRHVLGAKKRERALRPRRRASPSILSAKGA